MRWLSWRKQDSRNLALAAGAVFAAGMLSSCAAPPPQKSAAEHRESLGSTQERRMTLGVVQSRIREEMSQADVAAALGSPNIVTTDAEGNETWIYDKIATETSHSTSSRSEGSSVGGAVGGGVGAGGILGTVPILGGILGGVGASQSTGATDRAGATSQTQRTLTVVIKFDSKRLVKSVRSQASSF